jgi:hypothetical protein
LFEEVEHAEPEGSGRGSLAEAGKEGGGEVRGKERCSRVRCANHQKVIAAKNAVKSESDVAQRILFHVLDERREQRVGLLQLQRQ